MTDYYYKRLLNFIRLKGYSESTLITYRSCLETILAKFPEPDKATLLEIQDFTISFTNDNYRRMICVVLRWLFDSVLHKPIDWRDLPFPKRSRKVQPIYTHEEIMKVFHSVKHRKQKAILGLLIDKGLRISEPLKIKISDCNSKEGKIVLRGAKSGDRIIYPSEYVWELIKDYWNDRKEKPVTYLFEGVKKGLPYTKESVRGFIELHCKMTGVEYKGVHSIRRMVGTWWVENKVPETVAADLLGHSSIRPLHKHYLIHSPSYLRNVASPLA